MRPLAAAPPARSSLDPRSWVFSLLLLLAAPLQAQWVLQESNTSASLRGLSVVNARVAWASGSGGTVIHTVDGGTTWIVQTVPGVRAPDLRSIAALDEKTAVVAATSGHIWRTDNGGRRWTLVYVPRDSAVFLDAIGFWEAQRGSSARALALGDPINGQFFVLISEDAGRSWHVAPSGSRPTAEPGEGAFAASGSAFITHGARNAWIGTGVRLARVFRTSDAGNTWAVSTAPLADATQSSGVFALSFADAMRGVAVGGDYDKAEERKGSAAVTLDGGITWVAATTLPNGFRSGVAIVPGTDGAVVVAVGPTGTDVSLDGGRNWTFADSAGFHAVRFAPDGSGFASGGRGRIARFNPDFIKKP